MCSASTRELAGAGTAGTAGIVGIAGAEPDAEPDGVEVAGVRVAAEGLLTVEMSIDMVRIERDQSVRGYDKEFLVTEKKVRERQPLSGI